MVPSPSDSAITFVKFTLTTKSFNLETYFSFIHIENDLSFFITQDGNDPKIPREAISRLLA